MTMGKVEERLWSIIRSFANLGRDHPAMLVNAVRIIELQELVDRSLESSAGGAMPLPGNHACCSGNSPDFAAQENRSTLPRLVRAMHSRGEQNSIALVSLREEDCSPDCRSVLVACLIPHHRWQRCLTGKWSPLCEGAFKIEYPVCTGTMGAMQPKRYRKRCEQQIGMSIQENFAPLLRNCAQLAAAEENTDKRTVHIFLSLSPLSLGMKIPAETSKSRRQSVVMGCGHDRSRCDRPNLATLASSVTLSRQNLQSTQKRAAQFQCTSGTPYRHIHESHGLCLSKQRALGPLMCL